RPVDRTADLSTTELSASAVRSIEASALPPLQPTVLGIGGRSPPTEHVDADPAVFAPERDGIDFYESLEGMWVRLHDARVVGPTNAYDEAWVVADGGATATSRRAPFGLVTTAADDNPELLKVSGARTA